MPPRRKKQKTAHNALADTGSGALAQDQNPAEPGSSAPSITAVATAPSWKGAKRRRASMEKFIDGPVDIVVEVLIWLHPRDLCTLVRTSSVFKNFLLSKDRRQLWKTVIANATDLPPQPPFLSEPAFVHLLYSHHCHNCGTVARQVITAWFKRTCSKCIPEVSVTWRDARSSIRAVGKHTRSGYELYKIFDLIPNGKQPSYMTYHFGGSEDAYRCSNADVNRYIRQLRKIKKNHDQNEREKEKAGQAIVNEWMKRLIRRKKYSAFLKEWFEKEERGRLAVLEDKKAQRFTEIIERLRESEWAKEIEFLSDEEMDEMSMLPVVRRSSKLTKSEWASVLVALDGFLNKTRERRLLAERQAAIRTRLGELEKAMLEHYVQLPRTAAMDVRPNYIEFALMDKCKALANAPVSRTITSEDFLAILPELHKKWHTSAKTRLVKAVQKTLRSPSVSITTRDPLNLAITVFVCAHCSPFAYMRYPAVLAHVCGYTKDGDKYYSWEDLIEPPKASDVYASTAKKLHVDEDDYQERKARGRFSLTKVVGPEDSYIGEVLEPMCTIVRALGLDPATATATDLEACDARLMCTTCMAEGRPDVIYGWDAALWHFLEFRRSHAKWKWKRVHGADMDKVHELEAERDTQPLAIHRHYSIWACALCQDWDGSGADIEAHLLNDHGLEEADACAQNGTIYLHQAKNRVLMRPPVVLPSVETSHSSESAAQT